MPRRFRVCIYDPFTAGPGGICRHVQGVINGLSPEKFDVTVFCHPNRPFKVSAETRVLSVLPYLGVPAGSSAGNSATISCESSAPVAIGRSKRLLLNSIPGTARVFAGFVRSAMRIAPLFSGHGFDLVHTFETDADPAVVAARLAGVRHVLYTYQVDSTYRPESERWCPGHRLTEIITDHCLTCGIAVSERTRADRLGRTHVGPSRIKTIPNGIDTTRFVRTMSRAAARAITGLPDDGRLIVGTIGRLHEHKGHKYLIQALARLQRRDVIVAIAGRGECEAELLRMSRELNVNDQVVFLGQRSDVVELLQSFDVFALPSVCEALPYALLEAMSAGLPSVAADVGGVGELIQNGRSGLLVAARDPVGLAAQLARLLESPSLREEIGNEAGLRTRTHFHEPDMIRKTIDLYEQILS